MTTTFEQKCLILSDFWLECKTSEEYKDFIEYNDLGLPLAYCVANNLIRIKHSDIPAKLIEETFESLLAEFELKDEGFCCLNNILMEPCEEECESKND